MVRSAALVLIVMLAGVVSLGCGRAREATPDATQLLERAATRMERVQRFHYLLEHEHGATAIVLGIQMTRAEGDVAGPKTMRASVNGTFGNANLVLGVVVIGEQGWLQNPLTRRWEQTPLTMGDLIDPQAGLVTLIRGARDPRVTGSEELDGVRVWRVEGTVDSEALTFVPGERAPGRKLAAVAWIGASEPLVYRVELRGAATDTEPAEIVRRLTFSRFDADVTIEPPR